MATDVTSLTKKQQEAVRKRQPRLLVEFRGADALELRDQYALRGNILDAAKAIHETAKSTNRDLTGDEDAAYQGLWAMHDAMNETVRTSELDIEDQRAQAARDSSGGTGAGNGVRYRTPDGREVRVLGNTERVSDSVQEKLPSGIREEDLDFARMLRGMVTGEWDGAEAERRVMGEGPDTLGGFTVPLILSAQIIDSARNKTQVIQAGAQTVQMTSAELEFARVTQDPTAAVKAENAALTFSDMSFDKVVMSARTVIGGVKMSVELMQDAANTAAEVRSALAQALALELDRLCLFGIGAAEEPTGIINTAGIQTIDLGTNGAALTDYDDFSTAWQMVQNVNGAEDLSVIYAPRTAGVIDRLKDTTNQPLRPPESWTKHLTKFSTNQVPIDDTQGTASDASRAVVGDFSQLFIGVRQNASIAVSREASDSSGSAFSNFQVWVMAALRFDCVLVRENHMVDIKGIIP